MMAPPWQQALRSAASAAGLGVAFPAGSATVVFTHGAGEAVATVTWAPRLEVRALLPAGADIYVTERLTRKDLREARFRNVSVADRAGNAHLELPGLFVHVEGRKAVPRPPGRPSELGPNTARLLHALLREGPMALGRTRRSLSKTTGLPLGTVQRQIAALETRGWLGTDPPAVRGPEALLKAWETLYVAELRPRLLRGEARPAASTVEAWLDSHRTGQVPRGLLLGSALAAERRGLDVVGASVVVHVSESLDEAATVRALRQLGLVRSEGGPVPIVAMPGEATGAAEGIVDDALLLGELSLEPEERLVSAREALRRHLLGVLGGRQP